MLAELFSDTGLIVIAVVAVLLFGGSKLPKFAKSLGSAQKEYKKGLAEGKEDSSKESDSPAVSDS